MKYILMMNTMKAGSEGFPSWPKKDIQAHIAFMKTLNTALRESGELCPLKGYPFRSKPSWCGPARMERRSRTACFRSPKNFSPAIGSSKSTPPNKPMRLPHECRRHRDSTGRR